MKTRGFIVIVIALALTSAPLVNTSGAQTGGYSARLISPTAGQVLYPGQQVQIQWQATIPKINAGGCEMELFLSLDGGQTFTYCITPQLPPTARFFNWTVPNMPTNRAVLDIRFGCEWYYPENYSPQPASTFVIANIAPGW
jgi:hypothetical protein